jgi:integrase
VIALLKVTEHPRDKAFLLTLDECAGRIQEILTLVIGRVTFDEYGAVIHLKGSKGERGVRLIASASALANWINHHPLKNRADARRTLNSNEWNGTIRVVMENRDDSDFSKGDFAGRCGDGDITPSPLRHLLGLMPFRFA